MIISSQRNKTPVFSRLRFAALLAVCLCVVYSPSLVHAKKKTSNYATIRIQSNPEHLPLEVDGKSYGVTTANYTAIEHLEPGLHTIVVILPDGKRWTREIDLPAGRIKCVSLNYRPITLPIISPCPFPVRISGPSQLTDGEVISYQAQTAYAGSAALIYTWTVSPASVKVLSGLGTPKIEVDSTGLAGRRVTATLVVDDGSGDASCRQIAQASTFIPAPEKPQGQAAKEFDVCSSCTYDDQKARLDNLAIELQNDPTSRTYIVANAGRNSRPGQAQRLLERAQKYLVNQRGIDSARIVLINGSTADQESVEIWIVPQGATPPGVGTGR